MTTVIPGSPILWWIKLWFNGLSCNWWPECDPLWGTTAGDSPQNNSRCLPSENPDDFAYLSLNQNILVKYMICVCFLNRDRVEKDLFLSSRIQSGTSSSHGDQSTWIVWRSERSPLGAMTTWHIRKRSLRLYRFWNFSKSQIGELSRPACDLACYFMCYCCVWCNVIVMHTMRHAYI